MFENEAFVLIFKLLFGGLFALLIFFYLFGVFVLVKYGRSRTVVFLVSAFAGLLLVSVVIGGTVTLLSI
jgi:uncharacterized membrane protein